MIPAPTSRSPHLRKAKASPPSAIAPANRSQNDRPAPAPHPPHSCKAQRSQNDLPPSAPLPLSQREQQVCDYLSQGISFETIARHLNCSPAAARTYYRRAISKRQRTIASASLEQGDSSAPRVRKAKANPEPALAKVPCDRPASALASICTRSPFHSPAVDALTFRERPNAIDCESVTDLRSGYIDVRTCQINLLKIPESLQSLERLPDQSKALEGDESAKGWDFVGRKLRTKSTHSPQTTIIDSSCHPFRRSRRAGFGFRVASAS